MISAQRRPSGAAPKARFVLNWAGKFRAGLGTASRAEICSGSQLYLHPFECLDSLVCLSRKLLGRLQKQLAQLAFIQVELFHQLLVFREITCFSQQALPREPP